MKLITLFTTAMVPMLFIACKKDAAVVPATVVKEWNIALAARNENNPPTGRTETGTAALKLMSDNSLTYTITVNGLQSGDVLNADHIHVGDVISNGSVVLGLDPVFTGNTSSGMVANIRTSLVDSLKMDMNELYFNVHSTQVASGLVRGQLNKTIDVASFVSLTGASEVPAVTTTATGTALIRVTSDKTLYTKVIITSLETTDMIMAAHIHTGATGVNGGILVGICAATSDFGLNKIFTLTDAQYNSLKTDALYVNAHSVVRTGGVVRGQIR